MENMTIPMLSLNDGLINQAGMGNQLSLAYESSQKFRVALVIFFSNNFGKIFIIESESKVHSHSAISS